MAEWLGDVKEVTAEFEGRVVKGWYFVSGVKRHPESTPPRHEDLTPLSLPM
jgi:hypothetical protein